MQAFVDLTSHTRPADVNYARHCRSRNLRGENIRRAVLRGDPIILGLPELPDVVHGTPRGDNWHIGGYYERFHRACSEEGYSTFVALAADYGFKFPHGTPTPKKRRARIRSMYDHNRIRMGMLLFVFEYGYDPNELSLALKRVRPRTPKLERISRDIEQLPLAA